MSATHKTAIDQSNVETPRKKTMSPAAQAANRANAQKSTGPRTAEGRAKSAANRTSHGLQANPTTIFENNPHERARYEELKAELFAQCLPEGRLERETFERYTFATFQADRARNMEIDTQDRWLGNPENATFFHQMEHFTRLAALQERRADKAMNELRKLQFDRVLALDVHSEHYILEKKIDIPASLPMAKYRSTDLSKTGNGIIAIRLLALDPEVREIIDKQIKPKEAPIKVTQEDIAFLRQHVKL